MQKYYLLLLTAAALLIGCNGHNTPQVTQSVTFNVSTFSQSTEQMHAPAATILDDEGGTALTDLYVFEGTTQLIHQTNDADDFGTVTLNLSHGNHTLSFVMTRSIGTNFASGLLTFSSVRSTFGTIASVNVTGSTGSQDITLDRISGQMIVTIEDAFPANADEIEFVIDPRYAQLDITTLKAVNGSPFTQRLSCTYKVGLSDVQYTFTHICPSLIGETTADVTINVYDNSNNQIAGVNIKDVRMAANTKTILTGKLFVTPVSTIKPNTSWNASISQSW